MTTHHLTHVETELQYNAVTVEAANASVVAAVCVGKIAEQLDLKGRFLNAKTLASVFFMIDILCIGVQGAGAAIISATLQNSGTASQSGTNIYLIGLAIQLFFFASFAGVTAYVYHLQRTKAANAVPIQLYICLAATIVLITLRNIYRVIEIAVSYLLAMLIPVNALSLHCWAQYCIASFKMQFHAGCM